MNNNKFSIGVLGGMGTYATIHLFTQFANIFPAIKEWERPRIIIDNRSDMPSRVKAWLSHEDEKVLVNQMVDSTHYLIELDVNYIIIACNTAHLFLPKSRGLISNIVVNCVEDFFSNNINQVTILGTEATVKSRVYQDLLFGGDNCHFT
jgi:aspartate racemase